MNILGISNKHSGCGYHRILLPLGFMDGIKGYVTNAITADKALGWDVMLFNRVTSYDQMWQDVRNELGVSVAMDMDDHWRLPPSHVLYHQYESIAERIENNLREADVVTCTSEILAEKIRPFNSNVHIIPNALPYGANQFNDDKRESERVRIFWAGSVTHERDLMMLRNPLQKLSVYSDKIQMVIAGYNDQDEVSKTIWQRMFSCFTSGGQLPYMKIHAIPPTSYMQAYENADIMLVPLEESDWHSCKSNLKILEAACKRIPCIVSNVMPYNLDKDAPVLWVNSQKDWFKHLKFLINEPDERIKLGNQLYEWATKKYNLFEINKQRREVLASICHTPAHT